MKMSRGRVVRWGAVVSAIALGALAMGASPTASVAAVSQHTAPTGHTAAGHMTPAVTTSPHYRRVGSTRGPDAVFSCQTTRPAACYGPAQIRHAYGFDRLGRRGVDGRGTTIVIVDAFQSPTIRHDLSTFSSTFGLPHANLRIIAPQGLTPFDPSNDRQVGWAGEISLDVEWAHAIAPKAKIDLVLATSDDDAAIDRALAFVAARRLGDVVSQSYGEAEQCLAAGSAASEHRIFQRMVSHGTTVLASSGDEGAAQPSCDGTSWVKSASTPASDPLVTGIGGTALFADGATGDYNGEKVWNEPEYGAAAGSGFSSLFAEPTFQRRVQDTGHRSVPDVSYSAAIKEAVLMVWSTSGEGADAVFAVGGTSAGSPQWAGLVALADQVAGHRLGNINPALYRLGASRAYGAFFHDVTRGNTSVTLPDASGHAVSITGSSAHRGWDAATGFGSPKANVLVPALGLARD